MLFLPLLLPGLHPIEELSRCDEILIADLSGSLEHCLVVIGQCGEGEVSRAHQEASPLGMFIAEHVRLGMEGRIPLERVQVHRPAVTT